MENTNQKTLFFALHLIVFLGLLAETARQIDVLNSPSSYTNSKVYLAYFLVVVLPTGALFALYRIIKSKSYKKVYPFKWI